MARTVQECNAFIVQNLVSEFASVGITINPATWSTRNLLRLICYTFAIAQSLAEQIQDVYLEKITAIQTTAAAGSKKWLQDRAFRFQYSATVPQYVSYNTTAGPGFGSIDYSVINPALRITTACAVQSSTSNIIDIKVAKGSPLGPFAALEISAMQSYFDTIGVAGIVYNVYSTAPDQIYIKGDIYYDGVYSAIIQAKVITAIESFFENLSKTRFGGDLLLSDLKSFIRSIEGVNDISIERIACRTDVQTIFTGTDLVVGFDELSRKYKTDAGYLITEQTASNTLADTLNFIPE